MSVFQKIMPLAWWGMFGLLFAVLILLVITVSLYRRMKRYEAAHLSLETYLSGKSIDLLLREYLESVEMIKKQISNCSLRLEKTESKLRLAVDRAELVRFSAFENMGSELSFALALLNQDGNGVVLSSINNREESRVYAKPVIAGKSSYNLSAEERDVITKAQIGVKI
ncbi:MAG: DUF4446 family protein [Desulfitobacteriaceae bacterium]